jgi:hypothetical protein
MSILSSRGLAALAVTVLLLFGSILTDIKAQQTAKLPDLSAAGVRLGDRASAKKFLAGYQYRIDGGVPTYYFYNSHITTVLKLTGASFDDPYFITGIEVYNVGPEYQNKHFVLEKLGHFLTESGIHVGYRQSGGDLAFSLTVGIPGVVGDSITGPKYVLKKIGEPDQRAKNGEEEIFDYRIDGFSLPYSDETGRTAKYDYKAHYRFYRNRLNRFSMTITTPGKEDASVPKP